MACERWAGRRNLRDGDAGGRGAAAQAPRRPTAPRLYKRCAPVPRYRREPRAEPRAVPRHVGRACAGGDGNRQHGHHGQQPRRAGTPRHRRVRHRANVRRRRSCTTPGAEGDVPGAAAAFNLGPGRSGPAGARNTSNTRFQDGRRPHRSADVPRLKLKWAFAFPGDLQSYSQATLAGGRLFVGSWGGKVYSLNAATGCIHWFFEAGGGVRSAVSVGRVRRRTGAAGRWRSSATAPPTRYAVDAATGALVWKVEGRRLPRRRASADRRRSTTAGCTCRVASGEEGSGASPTYECCRFRGSIVALDAATGSRSGRRTRSPRSRSRPRRTPSATQLWGPSGAPVWSSPAIDVESERALRHHRQQLQRSDDSDERCVRGAGSRLRQDSVVTGR